MPGDTIDATNIEKNNVFTIRLSYNFYKLPATNYKLDVLIALSDCTNVVN